jgi:hypothetical protein
MPLFSRLILVFWSLALVVLFVAAVLCWLVVYVTIGSVRWLVTGQKPQIFLMWQQVQAMRKGIQSGEGAAWSSWSRTSDGQWHAKQGFAHRGDSKDVLVEDVVVREVHQKGYLPKD